MPGIVPNHVLQFVNGRFCISTCLPWHTQWLHPHHHDTSTPKRWPTCCSNSDFCFCTPRIFNNLTNSSIVLLPSLEISSRKGYPIMTRTIFLILFLSMFAMIPMDAAPTKRITKKPTRKGSRPPIKKPPLATKKPTKKVVVPPPKGS